MKNLRFSMILLSLLVCCRLSVWADPVPAPAGANSMVHQSGSAIVDGEGKPLYLRGVNLGGWLLWEGWIFGKGIANTETTILSKLASVAGADETQHFKEGIYQNYITEADIAKIAALGFNSVRVPFNARLLGSPEGWTLLDNVIGWCEKYKVYVILDMHAIPGGQSTMFTADPGPSRELVWNSKSNQEKTVALWKQIAERYSSRSIVAGYDLINEPKMPSDSTLVSLYQQIIAAVRQVDAHHMVIVEGNKLAADFSMFSHPLDSNQVYSFHMYTWFGDNRQKRLDSYKTLSAAQNVPLWCGEFGENTYGMISGTKDLFENPDNKVGGWAFWTWKKVPNKYPGLATITPSDHWRAVIDWAGAAFGGKKPNRETAIAGMNEFVQSVKLENNKIDSEMVSSLVGKK